MPGEGGGRGFKLAAGLDPLGDELAGRLSNGRNHSSAFSALPRLSIAASTIACAGARRGSAWFFSAMFFNNSSARRSWPGEAPGAGSAVPANGRRVEAELAAAN